MISKRILNFALVLCSSGFCDTSKPNAEPLILTPYLKAGKFKEAQEKARVVPDIGGVKSFSGFFTVNKECGNNLFFWFLPAENNWESAPVLLWLNGGPGSTSLFGMFTEIGPFDHFKKKGIVKRNHYWTKDNNVIFLDQPVGAGFSFTEKDCYAENLTMLSQDVYAGLLQFFTLFPNLQKNKFFLTGESYAGHYIPAIAQEIDNENDKASLKINLVGIVVGNPFMDVRCDHQSQYFYELGIIDERERDIILDGENNITAHVNANNITGAIAVAKDQPELNIILPSFYNIIYDDTEESDFALYVREYKTRLQIHVGDTPFFSMSETVHDHLEKDTYIAVNEIVENLLKIKKYIVGFYSGQLDTVVLYTTLPCVLRQLKWPGAGDYLAANRSQWYVGDRLAGWYKDAGNLFEVVIRNSGHFVPTDQPIAALELITAITADKPGSKLLTKLKTQPPDTTCSS